MNIEKISRREFLIGAVSAAVLTGCKKLESFTPTIEPTEPPLPIDTPTSIETPLSTRIPILTSTETPTPSLTPTPARKPTPELTPTVEPTATPELSEILIGKDFIALSDEKILELLNLPENRGKIVFPGNLDVNDVNTRVRIDPPAIGGNGDIISVLGFKDGSPESRKLYNPSTLGVEPLTSLEAMYFFLSDGNGVEIGIRIKDPETALINPEEAKKARFGDVLAIGYKNETDPEVVKRFGPFCISIFAHDPQDVTKPFKSSEFRLMYKNLWVVRKISRSEIFLSPTATPRPTETLEPGETLIGKDFIALSDEKILELLNLPENKDKFILPVYVDDATNIKRLGGKGMYGLYIQNLKFRILFNPSLSSARLDTIIMYCGRNTPEPKRSPDSGEARFTMLGNKFAISIDNTSRDGAQATQLKIKPGESANLNFGVLLATGFTDRRPCPGSPEGNAVVIWPTPDSIGGDPMEYLVKYKGRWVARSQLK